MFGWILAAALLLGGIRAVAADLVLDQDEWYFTPETGAFATLLVAAAALPAVALAWIVLADGRRRVLRVVLTAIVLSGLAAACYLFGSAYDLVGADFLLPLEAGVMLNAAVCFAAVRACGYRLRRPAKRNTATAEPIALVAHFADPLRFRAGAARRRGDLPGGGKLRSARTLAPGGNSRRLASCRLGSVVRRRRHDRAAQIQPEFQQSCGANRRIERTPREPRKSARTRAGRFVVRRRGNRRACAAHEPGEFGSHRYGGDERRFAAARAFPPTREARFGEYLDRRHRSGAPDALAAAPRADAEFDRRVGRRLASVETAPALESIDALLTAVTAAGAERFRRSHPQANVEFGASDALLKSSPKMSRESVVFESVLGVGTIAQSIELRRLHARGKVVAGGMTVAVTDAGLPAIVAHPELEELDLRESEVTDQGIMQLKTLKSLKRLDLRGSPVTEQGAAKLARALPECEILR